MRTFKSYKDKPSYKRRDYKDNFYCTTRWRQLRMIILSNNPLCADPFNVHDIKPLAVDIDHIKPRRKYPELSWDINNLQPLCKSCHSRKKE